MKNRILVVVTLFFVLSGQINAQSLWDSLVEVRKCIKTDQDQKADSLLTLLESQCVNNPDDTIKVVYFESKGIILWSQSKYKLCIPYFERVIDLYEKLQIKDINYLEAFQAIAFSYGRIGDFDNAEKYFRKALIKSSIARNPENFRSMIYQNLGYIYKEKGDTLLANECFKRVEHKSNTKLVSIHNLNYLEWENSLWEKINSSIQNKKYQDAANFYLELIEGMKNHDVEDKHYISALYSRGILLSRYLNEYSEAIKLFDEVILFADKLDTIDGTICGAYCNLAQCLTIQKNFSRLEQIVQLGYSYLVKAKNDEYPPQMIYRFIGNGAYWKEDYFNAIKYYQLYLDSKYEREKGTNYEEIVNNLSVAYIFSGMYKESSELLSMLLKTDKNRLQSENPITLASIYHNLGRAFMLQNQKKDALDFLLMSKELQTEITGKVMERTEQYINECR